MPYHIPALLPQAIEALNIRPDGTYVDVTFGAGGHSSAILEKLSSKGHLYSFDQDPEAVANAFCDDRFTIVYSNFRYISNFMAYYGVDAVDGILADLGVSFHHFDEPERGFSFRWDNTPLDMRMNQKSTRTAEALLAETDEEELTRIFRLYGELKNAHSLARAIVNARNNNLPVKTTTDLYNILSPLLNPAREKKDLACIYQALRIVVNDELGALKSLLKASVKLVRPGGRIAIITYHSLEDRLVKNFFKTGNIEGLTEKDIFGNYNAPFRPIGNKPVVPDDYEIEHNPRSRSAKLRVAQKI